MRLPSTTLILLTTITTTTTTLTSALPTPQRYTHDNELVPPPPPPPSDTPRATEDAIFKTMTTPHIPTQEEGLGGRKGTISDPPLPPPPRKSIGTVPPPLRDTPVNPITNRPPEPPSTNENGAFDPKDIWGEGEENPYDWPRREPEFGSLWRYPRPEPKHITSQKS
ncbi:hypothetical protein QBC36DRAFT_289789 [Triangularia setosa]|uniref:Uncharacterized protein n=1 Tax=Triangularia setosa TaxID=2587417 RepID=A0AAN6WAX4_9PEZI|nr:hypothetical protein QBC36DRAFT_289789 [Podospora setosa]